MAVGTPVEEVRAPAPVKAPELLVPRELCGAPATGTVTRAQALQDLELARHILARGYAGYDVLAGRGVKWAQIFAAARARIQAGPEETTPEALRLFKRLVPKEPPFVYT